MVILSTVIGAGKLGEPRLAKVSTTVNSNQSMKA